MGASQKRFTEGNEENEDSNLVGYRSPSFPSFASVSLSLDYGSIINSLPKRGNVLQKAAKPPAHQSCYGGGAKTKIRFGL
jgi:hypothetical protein